MKSKGNISAYTEKLRSTLSSYSNHTISTVEQPQKFAWMYTPATNALFFRPASYEDLERIAILEVDAFLFNWYLKIWMFAAPVLS